VQPPCDHQVQDQEDLAVQLDHDPLAQPSHASYGPPFRVRKRRRDRPEEERAREAHLLQALAADQVGQALHVDHDVGKLGHPPRMLRQIRPVRRAFLDIAPGFS
jgi:hypothetical protein